MWWCNRIWRGVLCLVGDIGCWNCNINQNIYVIVVWLDVLVSFQFQSFESVQHIQHPHSTKVMKNGVHITIVRNFILVSTPIRVACEGFLTNRLYFAISPFYAMHKITSSMLIQNLTWPCRPYLKHPIKCLITHLFSKTLECMNLLVHINKI